MLSILSGVSADKRRIYNELLEDYLKDHEDLRDSKDVKEVKDYGIMKDVKDVKDSKSMKDMKDIKDSKSTKNVKNAKDIKDSKSVKDVKDSNSVKDVKDWKEVKNIKDSKGVKDVKDSKNVNDGKNVKEATDVRSAVFSSHIEPLSSIKENKKRKAEKSDIKKKDTKKKDTKKKDDNKKKVKEEKVETKEIKENKIITNLLEIDFPNIFRQLHSTRNGALDIKFLRCDSEEEIWWQCDKHWSCGQHEWLMSVAARIRGNNCIWCFGKKWCGCRLPPRSGKGRNSPLFRDKYSSLVCEILEEYNRDLNLHTLSYGSGEEITWKCRKAECSHHIWTVGADHRRNNSCPFCSNNRVCICNSILTLCKNLVKEIDKDKYTEDLSKISPGSGIELPWKCVNPKVKCNHHRWTAVVYSRVAGGSCCPFCSGNKICPCSSFAVKYPHLLKEVDMNIHKNLDFTKISPGANIDINWICSVHKTCDQHRWKVSLISRTRNNTKCPFCINHHGRVCPCNSFQTVFPDIAKEIDRERCDINLLQIAPYSGIIIPWKCGKCDHKWSTPVSSRSNGSGCPQCALSKLEEAFKNVLNEFNLDYEPQKRFKECKHEKTLPFDFYIPFLNLLVELDGIQHFEIAYFGGKPSSLNLQRILDTIKTKFAKKRGFNFLRISYSELNNIETYATTFIVLNFLRRFLGGERVEKFYGKEYNEEYKRTHII